MRTRRQSLVADAILDYLRKNPEAQDTLEGVVEWWLPAQGFMNRMAAVKEALDELVAEGVLSERTGRDAQVSYRLTTRGLRDLGNNLTQ